MKSAVHQTVLYLWYFLFRQLMKDGPGLKLPIPEQCAHKCLVPPITGLQYCSLCPVLNFRGQRDKNGKKWGMVVQCQCTQRKQMHYIENDILLNGYPTLAGVQEKPL